MFIEQINLIGFRNYLEANIIFEKQKTIIIGKNAQGKSNLLEVIQILSTLKSRRASRDGELVNFALNEAIIKSTIRNESEKNHLAVLLRKSGKKTLKVNDINQKAKEFLHQILSVSFMVDDIDIVNGSPTIRRQYLDSVINQYEADYDSILDAYEKILSQRNSFIKKLNEKQIFHPSQLRESHQQELTTWDTLLIEKSNELINRREKYLNALNPHFQNFYQQIAGYNAQLEITYLSQKPSTESLKSSLAKDLARSFTNLGPHRDDFDINLSEHSVKDFASQGEKRCVVLALKLAELELLKKRHDEYPILLLDDVLAELDENRQDYLLEAIDPKTQVIITTTHLGSHLEKWSQDAQVIEINNGSIVRDSSWSLI